MIFLPRGALSNVSNDAILDQTLECLRWHHHREWGDREPLDVLNRLLAKNINPDGCTPKTHLNIQRHQIKSRKANWSLDELAKLDRGHADISGTDFECPIIVVEYQSKQRLLDGNHRINRWLQFRNTKLHEVNIHTVEGVGQFIELSPAQV
jgi:hypothetical protein